MIKKLIQTEERIEPLITSYWHWSDQLIIIRNIDIHNYWLFNNFINLKADIDCLPGGISFANLEYRNKMVEFFDCPYINMQKICFNKCKAEFDIIYHLESAIKSGWYALLMVDRSYLNSYFKKTQTFHQIMVHGYDSIKKLFYFCDNDLDGKFQINLSCTYHELKEAFDHFICFDLEPDMEDSIFLFQGRKNTKYGLNIKKIQNGLLKYLNPALNVNESEFNLIYGVEIYDNIIENLKLYSNKDTKGFSVLYDHKKVMHQRLLQLSKHHYIKEESAEAYVEIVDLSKKVLLLYLKFLISGNKKILKNCTDYLNELKDKEIKILHITLQSLK